jgi:hypothetical protein
MRLAKQSSQSHHSDVAEVINCLKAFFQTTNKKPKSLSREGTTALTSDFDSPLARCLIAWS